MEAKKWDVQSLGEEAAIKSPPGQYQEHQQGNVPSGFFRTTNN